ncbi:uncharacterized protein [Physcomitrium patens]|uniref:uncharacterized protein isoform X2 n=1 Tax=Physcomitrium patens TaxID=3218 RepID=UPI003CCE50DE
MQQRLRNSTPYRNLVLSSKNATCVFGWNQFPKIAKGAHINIFCPQSHGPTPVFTACESRDKNSGDLRKLWASPDTSPDMIPLGVHAPRNLATSSLPDLEQKFSCKVGQSGLITASETLMSTEPQNFTKNVRITTAPHLQTQKSDEPGFLQVQSGLRRVSCSVGPTDRRKQIDHLQDPIASPGEKPFRIISLSHSIRAQSQARASDRLTGSIWQQVSGISRQRVGSPFQNEGKTPGGNWQSNPVLGNPDHAMLSVACH